MNTGFRKKINWSPVFPSFVFVNVTETQFNTVRGTGDVINFMFWLGKPAVIADIEINNIQEFVRNNSNVGLEKTAIVKNQAFADITESEDHSFNTGTSTAEQVNAKLLLPSLGYLLIANDEKPYKTFGGSFSINNSLS